MQYSSDPLFVFDLDDTLYPERAYVRSAFAMAGALIDRLFSKQNCAQILDMLFEDGGGPPLQRLWLAEGLPEAALAQIVQAMQAHVPEIVLHADAARLLQRLRASRRQFAIVTDGRSITQRAKIAALDCMDAAYLSISEEVGLDKRDPQRFLQVADALPASSYVYVGDNPAKDFFAPNVLGWLTIMRADGSRTTHGQELGPDTAGHPALTVVSLDSVVDILGT